MVTAGLFGIDVIPQMIEQYIVKADQVVQGINAG